MIEQCGREDPLAGTPIVVMGLMGAGKTTVGRGIAHRWGRVLSDSDAVLLAETGRTAAQLAVEFGIEALHEMEARHLLDGLAARPAQVLAAAASTVERADCRAALQGAVVVWLDVDLTRLADRMPASTHRPHYTADLGTTLTDLDAQRRPLFEQVADVVIHPWIRPRRRPSTEGEIADLIDQTIIQLTAHAEIHARLGSASRQATAPERRAHPRPPADPGPARGDGRGW